jgi:hypothetical protein
MKFYILASSASILLGAVPGVFSSEVSGGVLDGGVALPVYISPHLSRDVFVFSRHVTHPSSTSGLQVAIFGAGHSLASCSQGRLHLAQLDKWRWITVEAMRRLQSRPQ